MNVCLISREFPPFFGGGIATYAVQWSRALAAAGHRVVVLTVSDDGTQTRETSGEITIIRLPFVRAQDWSGPDPAIATPEVSAAFQAFSKVAVFAMQVDRVLPTIIAEFAVDVIEAPDTGALAWFALNSRRTGVHIHGLPAIVTTLHSPSDWISLHNRLTQTTRSELELPAMERDSVLWSDGLVCPSAALAAWSAKHWNLPPDRIEVIPYPLGDLGPIARRAAAAPHAAPSNAKFEFAFAGRLEPRKGVDTLIAGFAIAAADHPSLHLTLVGEDTVDPSGVGKFGQNCLRNLLPSALHSRVRVMGKQTNEQLSALRAAAAAVIIPSAVDNFPFTCVEAMAEGRLVIASSGGGTGEMIRDGHDGILFAPDQAASCAQAMLRAFRLMPPDRARLQAAAAARILDLCDDAKIVPRRIAHYQQAMTRARIPRPIPGPIPYAIINRSSKDDNVIRRLAEGMRHARADFAHGWGRTGDGSVLAFSTPTVQSLALAPRVIGPIVVQLDAIERAGIGNLLLPVRNKPPTLNASVEYLAQSSWVVLMLLAAAGARGAVIHDAVVDLSVLDVHPADQALSVNPNSVPILDDPARQHLDAIHASRGWKALQRVYNLLHILRGRGLRRPDYHPPR